MPVDDTVLGLWQALSRRDWDAVKTFLSADCIYVDMPVGPSLAARGPDDIVKRLKVGLEPLAGYENYAGVLLSNGSDAMYEHSETWRWSTGETAVLQFVSVQRVEDGKVTLWKDYSHRVKRRVKRLVSASCEQRQPPGCLRSPTMTATPRKTGQARGEFSDDVLASVEAVRTAAIEAPCRAA